MTKASPKPVVKKEADDNSDEAPQPRKISRPQVDLEEDDLPSPKKKPRKPVAVQDEGDDIEEDDPKPKKKGKKSSNTKGNNLPLFIAGGVGAVIVIGLIVWFVFLKDS